MQQLQGRVAVVTGAASGIGRALSRAFGAEGMCVVLADVDAAALEETACDLAASGVEALAVRTDVSKAGDVRDLADRALERFGAVHVVCNNAGVFTGGLTWETPVEDYDWLLGVNLWGVIHGIRTFVPILLAQAARGEEGHVVNTASMAALVSLPYAGLYGLSKHAVLALSESLFHELALSGTCVGVSVLCPEAVATRIAEAERNRPGGAADEAGSPARALVGAALRDATKQGISPEVIAARVLEAIRTRRFYVLSEDGWRRSAEVRMEDLRSGRNPTLAPPGAGDPVVR